MCAGPGAAAAGAPGDAAEMLALAEALVLMAAPLQALTLLLAEALAEAEVQGSARSPAAAPPLQPLPVATSPPNCDGW